MSPILIEPYSVEVVGIEFRFVVVGFFHLDLQEILSIHHEIVHGVWKMTKVGRKIEWRQVIGVITTTHHLEGASSFEHHRQKSPKDAEGHVIGLLCRLGKNRLPSLTAKTDQVVM